MPYQTITTRDGVKLATSLIHKLLKDTKGKIFPELKGTVQARRTKSDKISRLLGGHKSSDWSAVANNMIIIPYGYTVSLQNPDRERRKDDFKDLRNEIDARGDNINLLFAGHRDRNVTFLIISETLHFGMIYIPKGEWEAFSRKHPVTALDVHLGLYMTLKLISFSASAFGGFENTYTFIDGLDGGIDHALPSPRQMLSKGQQQPSGIIRQTMQRKTPSSRKEIEVLITKFGQLSHEFKFHRPVIGYVDQITPAYLATVAHGSKDLYAYKNSSLGLHHIDHPTAKDTHIQSILNNKEILADLPWSYNGYGLGGKRHLSEGGALQPMGMRFLDSNLGLQKASFTQVRHFSNKVRKRVRR